MRECGMTLTRIAAAALIAALAAGCSNARLVPLEEWEVEQMQLSFDRQARVETVGLPLLAAAAPRCGRDAVPITGAVFINYLAFAPMDRRAAQKILGDDDRLQVLRTGLADASGLMKGDILVRVGDDPAPRGETATREWVELSDRLARTQQMFDITVLRAGQEITLRLEPVPVCPYRIAVWEIENIFGRTTGAEINVSSGLLRFTRTDQELAVVLAHEIAHNISGHARLLRIGDLAGPVSIAMFDMVAAMIGSDARGALSKTSDPGTPQPRADAHPIELELEADYVGLYLMAAAGMNVEGAEQVWRRLATALPENAADPAYLENPTHPTHTARFMAFREWIPEIKAKQAQGLPLEPEKLDWRRWMETHDGIGAAPVAAGDASEEPAPPAP